MDHLMQGLNLDGASQQVMEQIVALIMTKVHSSQQEIMLSV